MEPLLRKLKSPTNKIRQDYMGHKVKCCRCSTFVLRLPENQTVHGGHLCAPCQQTPEYKCCDLCSKWFYAPERYGRPDVCHSCCNKQARQKHKANKIPLAAEFVIPRCYTEAEVQERIAAAVSVLNAKLAIYDELIPILRDMAKQRPTRTTVILRKHT